VVGEATAWRLELPPARHDRLAGARVAVMPPIEWLPLDPAVEAAVERAVAALRVAGARVATAAPGRMVDPLDHTRLYLRVLEVMVSSEAPRADREHWAAAVRGGGPLEEAMAEGWLAEAGQLLGWLSEREHYRAAYRAFFRDWDALLAPAFGVPAFPHTGRATPQSQRAFEVGGRRIPYLHQIAFPALATLSGQPATAFPAGRSDAGLPVGLQLIGPYLEDRTPIRLAGLLARELGGYTPPPGYESPA
jgi:amidase